MAPVLRVTLAVLIRWIHIASVVTLIGGFIFARYAVAPALATMPETERNLAGKRVVASFRPILYAVLITILGSGLYNYFSVRRHSLMYNTSLGIKLLFVLHIFAVSILYATRDVDEAKRTRWLRGLVTSGLIVIAISAYLRLLSFS